MKFDQIDITGCSIIGAITKLGHAGPKHFGIVIGKSIIDNKVYIAENCHTGYQLVTYDEFIDRYSTNGDIHLRPNDGEYSDSEVANRALSEISKGGHGKYNLLFNNCESFSNRVKHDTSISQQVINTIAVTALFFAGIWIIKQSKRA